MKNFYEIEKEIKNLFLDTPKSKNFSIGEVFCDFNDKEKGHLFLKKGEIRLIHKNVNNEIFTIHRFQEDLIFDPPDHQDVSIFEKSD